MVGADQAADVVVPAEPPADFQTLGTFAGGGDEAVEQRPLDIGPLDGDAGLAGVVERAADQAIDRRIQRRAVEHDHRVLAAQLERCGDHPLGRRDPDFAASRHAAGETDVVDVLDESRADFASSVHQLEEVGVEPALDE